MDIRVIKCHLILFISLLFTPVYGQKAHQHHPASDTPVTLSSPPEAPITIPQPIINDLKTSSSPPDEDVYTEFCSHGNCAEVSLSCQHTYMELKVRKIPKATKIYPLNHPNEKKCGHQFQKDDPKKTDHQIIWRIPIDLNSNHSNETIDNNSSCGSERIQKEEIIQVDGERVESEGASAGGASADLTSSAAESNKKDEEYNDDDHHLTEMDDVDFDSNGDDDEKKKKVHRTSDEKKRISSKQPKDDNVIETISITNLIVIQTGNPFVLIKSDLLISIKCSYSTSLKMTSGFNSSHDPNHKPLSIMSSSSSVISVEDHIKINTNTNHRTGKEGENVISSIGPPAPSLSFLLLDSQTGREKSTFNLGDMIRIQIRMSDERSYGIFLRSLIAFDESGNQKISLIDSNGCPVQRIPKDAHHNPHHLEDTNEEKDDDLIIPPADLLIREVRLIQEYTTAAIGYHYKDDHETTTTTSLPLLNKTSQDKSSSKKMIRKSLESEFEAFSFPPSPFMSSSDPHPHDSRHSVLNLKATVTTCIDRCQPVKCPSLVSIPRSEVNHDTNGGNTHPNHDDDDNYNHDVYSYGKRRRRRRKRSRSSNPGSTPPDVKITSQQTLSKSIEIIARSSGLPVDRYNYDDHQLFAYDSEDDIQKRNTHSKNLMSPNHTLRIFLMQNFTSTILIFGLMILFLLIVLMRITIDVLL